MAALTTVALMACSAPRMPAGRVGVPGAASLAEHRGIRAAPGGGEKRQPNNIILAAGGARPPPRPPPPPPRPPGRNNPRGNENEPARPESGTGRRLAGPPDAPYWEPVLEIPWRGSLQGPRPAPPERAPGEAARQAPPPPSQQPARQPSSRPATRTPQRDPTTPRATARSAQQAPALIRGLGNITHAGPLKPDVALKAAQQWLGAGYKEIAPGVFRSADASRQFRMTTSDLAGAHGRLGPHIHFEALSTQGVVLENLHVPLLP
jgi:hypothetical protein